MVKLSGTFNSASFRARSFSAGTAVSTGGLAVRSSSPVPTVVTVGSSYSPSSIFWRRSLSALDISSRRAVEASSTSSALTTPSATSFSA